MAKIRITPDTLEQQASQLNSLKDQHTTLYGNIKSLVDAVATEWEGEANRAFTESFRANDTAFRKFEADVESFRQRMLTAAREMRTAEAAVKSKMSQI